MHYYTRGGEPMHYVQAKSGALRPTTVADARRLGLVPSVTTIMSVADRPGLRNWLIGNAIRAALATPREEGETDDAYVTRIQQIAGETGRAAADRGTQIHDAIERFWTGGDPGEWAALAEATASKVKEHFALTDGWVAEQSFASDLGFGGKVDLHHPSLVVVDYKTKDRIDNPKRLAYREHVAQLAAYAVGLGLTDGSDWANIRLANVFVGAECGTIIVHEWSPDESAEGWRYFTACLALWQVANHWESNNE